MIKSQKNFINVEDYFNKVDVYSKIMRNNYMVHLELFGLLKEFIETTYKKKAFRLLDLGCGNGYFMSQVLQGTNIELYRGYDLSIDSLEEAKNNMNAVKCNKQLILSDISKNLLNSENGNKYNIIWSSYALHHLSLEEKGDFFKDCFKLLIENSCLIIVDFMNDYSSREECIEQYKATVEKKWTNLTREEKEYLYEHVLNFDFPEDFKTYKQLGIKSGFKTIKKLFQKDSWGYMIFKKATI